MRWEYVIFIILIISGCVGGYILGKHSKSTTVSGNASTNSCNALVIKDENNKLQFINAREQVFPQSDDNPTVMLQLEDKQHSIWHKRPEDNNVYTLYTMVRGIPYTLRDGIPGVGCPWGLVYMAPEFSNIGTTVKLINEKNSIKATVPVIPCDPELKYMGVVDNIMMWMPHRTNTVMLTSL